MLDLWPEDIGHGAETVTPLSLLKEQAAALGRKTKNVVMGKVLPAEGFFSNLPPGWFEYVFNIVAPVLGDYSYSLLAIAHPVDFYPVRISAGEDLLDGLSREDKPQLLTKKSLLKKPVPAIIQADSQESLETALRLLFNSAKTKKVIQAIIAQSMSVRN